MTKQAFGWIVIVVNALGTRRYQVAIRNRSEAINAVRRRVPGAAVAHVEAERMLAQREVSVVLRLAPGDVVQMP